MNPYLIDSHAHLDFDAFDADRDEVVYRANEADVRAIITIGIDLKSSRSAVQLSEKYSSVYATVGIHPHDVAEAGENDLAELEELLQHPKVVAIGEVGLDFYRNLSPPDLQRRYFRAFLNLSMRSGKPLIIHTREADEAILSILSEKGRSGWSGVFHCFSGDTAMAARALAMGFHISFTGVLTFKNSRAVDVMRSIPMDRLLLETDCPFMAPEPHRGKRNEPAFVHFIAQKMASVRGLSFAEVARATSDNAERLFQIRCR
ncbi:TatD family hydrolase [candidate division KSB1 bacterium]|nr:TatD family hydrolase [candidate division KSB1 bacterium]